MRGAALRRRLDGQDDIALAHTIASLSRAKRIERLSHYLPVSDAPARPAGGMLARLQAIAAATSGLG